MPSKDQESRNPPDDALELNKETLQDLDLEPIDAENVKGGGTENSFSVGGSRLPAMTSASVAANSGGFRQI
jgi:hypothetical protein